MKRIILCLAACAGLMAGCSDTQAVTTAAGLSGTYDLTVVGSYVFVTSSDRNELRVLDLEASPRDFVRAPNPLEPLAIPVLERPTYLTRDVYYRLLEEPGQDDEGNDIALPRGSERQGPYVYARSDGAQEISIVSASVPGDLNLRELYRLRLNRQTQPGIITAFAARGPGQGTGSILYYATQQASVATLWRQSLPAPDAFNPKGALPEGPTRVLDMPGETVAALLVLPSAPSPDPVTNPLEQEHVVVAARGTQGAVGRTFRMDAARPQAPVVNYAFPAPVRLLATHPVVADAYWEGDLDRRVPAPTNENPDNTRLVKACGIDNYLVPEDPPDLSDEDTTNTVAVQPQRRTLAAGEYVFGVLDESSCAGGVQCSGVLAVDSATGQVLNDATGVRMLPIRQAAGLPTGLTLVPDVRLYTRCSVAENHEIPRPLIGVVPSSDGQISIFDAVKLRSFDLNPDGPLVIAPGSIIDASGASLLGQNEDVTTYIAGEVRNGSTRSDTYRIVYEGALPPPRDPVLSAQTSQCDGTRCTFTFGSPRDARFILTGDAVVLEPVVAACEELTVTDKQEVAGVVVLTTGPLRGDCSARQRFSVRASSNSVRPFVVYSDGRGVEGRMNKGEILTIEGDYYFHPPIFSSQEPPFLVRLNLKALKRDPAVRGDQYIVAVQANYSPYLFSPDTGSLASGLSAYRLPGPVAHTRFKGANLAYIAYPSADGILQVNMGSITDNGAQSTGLVPFQ